MAGLINWRKNPTSNGATPSDVNHVLVGIDDQCRLYIEEFDGTISIISDSGSVASQLAAALTNYDLSTVVDSKIASAINNLIDGAPVTLDTLNELAAAIADDENFSTTITAAIANIESNLNSHITNISNPHNTTAAQVGLGNVDNTSDLDKPVSTAQQTALNNNSTFDRNRVNHTGLQIFNTITNVPTPTPALAGAIFLPRVNMAGNGYEFWRMFDQSDERTDGLINQQANIFEPFLSVNYDIPEDGRYFFDFSYVFTLNTTSSNFLAHIVDPLGNQIIPLHIEPQDSAGAGQVFPIIAGGVEGPATANTGTDQLLNAAGSFPINLVAGVRNFLLEWGQEVAESEAAIHRATFRLTRIP